MDRICIVHDNKFSMNTTLHVIFTWNIPNNSVIFYCTNSINPHDCFFLVHNEDFYQFLVSKYIASFICVQIRKYNNAKPFLPCVFETEEVKNYYECFKCGA